jgi:hypothetical protein
MKKIKFSSGYKHQLEEDYDDTLSIFPKEDIDAPYFTLLTTGQLKINKSYAWNGTSFVWDTKRNLRASLVHDAFYQMMRMELLSSEEWRIESDKIFYEMCIKDGVFKPIARMYQFILNKVGDFAADPKEQKEIKFAPQK